MDTRVISVSRRRSRLAPLLLGMMILLAVLFLLMGVMFDRGFMLPCFLMAVLYYIYRTLSIREYEYLFEGRSLQVDRIFGRSLRRTAIVVDLGDLIVLAPPDDPAVADYRRGGRKRAKKYDFTSYEEDIPYYTMIVKSEEETVKMLMDLDNMTIDRLKRLYPDKVIR